MIVSRLSAVTGVALLLVFVTSSAEGAKKNAIHTVHGTVVDVRQVDGKAIGTVTLKTHHKKKGTTVTQVVDRKFKVAAGTRVEIVSGKKGANQHLPATFTDVHDGEHVVLVAKGDVAEVISIHRGGKN
jgi:hypothetical protein